MFRYTVAALGNHVSDFFQSPAEYPMAPSNRAAEAVPVQRLDAPTRLGAVYASVRA